MLKLPGSEVSSNNISQVIQSVIKHFMDVDIPLKDLPSKQTVININDCPVYTPKNVHSNRAYERVIMFWYNEGWHNPPKKDSDLFKLQNGQ